MLLGKLEYQSSTQNTEKFSGKLKLKKDPKQQNLTFENFIPKGSKIRQTSYIFGLVVYTGMQCKMMKSSNYQKKKQDHFESISMKFTLFTMLVIIFFVTISIIVLLSRVDENSFMYPYDHNISNGMKIFNLLILYSQLIPINLYLIQDIIQLLLKFKIENEIQNNFKNQYIKINDSNSIADLGHVDYLLLDKTGTLTTSYQKIDCLLFGDLSFTFIHDELFQNLSNKYEQPIDDQQNRDHTENELLIALEYDYGVSNEKSFSMLPMGTKGIGDIKQSKRPHPNHIVFEQIQNIEYNDENKPQLKGYNEQRSIYEQLAKKRIKSQSTANNEDFLLFIRNLSNEMQNMNPIYYDSFMKCMILCHQARPTYYASEIIYESFSKTEEVALHFASLCGYQLEGFNKFESPDEYHCKIAGQVVKYKILGLNQFTESRNLSSVVIQAPPTSECSFLVIILFSIVNIPKTSNNSALKHLSGEGSEQKSLLICRGDYGAIKNFLNQNQKEKQELVKLLKSYKKRGIRMILYATKELNEKETEDFKREYNNFQSSLTSQDDQLEKLARKYEVGLNLLGIIGYKEELKPESKEFITLAKQSNINIWILSGDQVASTVSCSQSLKITDTSKIKRLRITKKKKAAIFTQITTAITKLHSNMTKKQKSNEKQNENENGKQTNKAKLIHSSTTVISGDRYKSMNKFITQINGNSLKIIQEDDELLSHFNFLACLSKCLIGYNLTPQQKKFLCSMIQNTFPGHPTVLAIGDGFNDALMMQQADISIEFVHRGKKTNQIYPQVNAGDILVTSFGQIRELLLIHGKQQSERSNNLIFELFYQSFFLGMTLFFFNWFCSFTATSLHDSMMLFLTNFLFQLPNLLVYGLFDQPSNPQINTKYPGLYIDGAIRKKYYKHFFILNTLAQSLIQSAAVFYSSVYICSWAMIDNGHPTDLYLMSTYIIYSYIFYSTTKIYIICLRRKINLIFFTQIFTFGLLLILIFVNQRGNFSLYRYEELTIQFFETFHIIIGFIFNQIMCFYISFMLDFIKIYYLPSSYEQFADSGSKSISNADILNTVKKKIDASKLVSKVFAGSSYLSSYIQEMLNPGDTQVTEMKLNALTLEIKELILEKKFNASKIDGALRYFKFIHIMLFIIFSIFTLTDYLVNTLKGNLAIEYIVICIILLNIVLLSFTKYMETNYYSLSPIVIGVLIAIKIIVDWVSEEINIALSAQLVFMISTIHYTNISIVPIFIYNIVYFLQFLVRIIVLASLMKDSEVLSGTYSQLRLSIYSVTAIIFISLAILVISINMNYKVLFDINQYLKNNKKTRNDFLARFQIEQDNNSARDILSILVPKFVQQSITSGQYTMQESQGDVSILFCYICDFDSVLKEEGKNIVPMLDSLFRVYDSLCLQHGVQKIETVGYTYMAAAGIKACENGISEHILKTHKTMRLVNLAFDMMKQVRGRQYGKGNQIEIKIGIHVGEVIAGVIGHHKPQFSLIGDPVNQTSRVASTGDTGAITLSEEAFIQVKKNLLFYLKKQKEAKGLGKINTYQVFDSMSANLQQSKIIQRFQNAFQLIKQQIKQSKLKKENNKQFFSKLKHREEIIQFKQQQVPKQTKTKIKQKIENENEKENIQIAEQIILKSEEDELYKFDDEKGNNEHLLLQPNRLLLTIPNEQNHIYKHFVNILKEKTLLEGIFSLLLIWMTYLILTLLLIIVRKSFRESGAVFIIRAIFLVSLSIVIPFYEKAFFNNRLMFVFLIVLFYGGLTTQIQCYLSQNKEIATISLLELIFILIVSCNLKIFNFVQKLSLALSLFIAFLILYGTNNNLSHYYLIFTITAYLIILLSSFYSIQENIQIFNNLQINEDKKVKQMNLVSQLLPTHAFLKLKNSNIYDKQDLTDEFNDVTMLFADIKGFTEYSHTQKPEGVVNMLRNLFTEFDKKCQEYNVYKVYTIGDCYVVMGFTNSAKRKVIYKSLKIQQPTQEAINTINMGFAMVEIIYQIRSKINFDKINMRIGIHTVQQLLFDFFQGYVIGGIIGTDIVRYDIYGKDVTIANKMESSGEEGRVMVSEETKRMVERSDANPFKFKKHKDVDLQKFNMIVPAYLVEKNEKFNKQQQN